MEEKNRLRIMIGVSIAFHLVIISVGILLATIRSQAGSVAAPGNAQIVELYDLAELSSMPAQEPKPVVQKPLEKPMLQKSQEGDAIAFRNLSTHVSEPTPTPKLIPTPTPKVSPTATVKPLSTPQPRPTPTPQKESVPLDEKAAALEIPRRQAVMPPDALPENPWAVVQKEQQQEMAGRSSKAGKPTSGVPGKEISGTSAGPQTGISSGGLPGGTPMTFETENEFPYPDYLEHIKAKIEGLWFPEGRGTVSIYLIIEKDGKILKSGVDKGMGFDVDKLRESIIRALDLIKRFNPLPEDYQGMVLNVRITVRR